MHVEKIAQILKRRHKLTNILNQLPLVADDGVLEGTGVGGPLELAIGVGLDVGEVVEKSNDGPLLLSQLLGVLGEGVAGHQLSALVLVLSVDALEHLGEVNGGSDRTLAPAGGDGAEDGDLCDTEEGQANGGVSGTGSGQNVGGGAWNQIKLYNSNLQPKKYRTLAN